MVVIVGEMHFNNYSIKNQFSLSRDYEIREAVNQLLKISKCWNGSIHYNTSNYLEEKLIDNLSIKDILHRQMLSNNQFNIKSQLTLMHECIAKQWKKDFTIPIGWQESKLEGFLNTILNTSTITVLNLSHSGYDKILHIRNINHHNSLEKFYEFYMTEYRSRCNAFKDEFSRNFPRYYSRYERVMDQNNLFPHIHLKDEYGGGAFYLVDLNFKIDLKNIWKHENSSNLTSGMKSALLAHNFICEL